ncbi:MAG: sigma-70 family RNA polymerase sigma factor [Oligoflexia bacterium]|nr:sigma-70 family RNA polymerase sigma factor [Oligoflexia bacterium]
MKADFDLVREIKAGKAEVFGELVRRHQRALFRLALRFCRDEGTAEDVVQESFVKAYQKLNSFEERSSFKSWLYRIAINTAKNKLRSGDHLDVDVEDVVLSVGSQAQSDLESQELSRLLGDEVKKLPERQREALTLRIYEDLSFQEIATIMGCPYDTAKANFRHAVLRLKKTLSIKGIDKLADWNLSDGQEISNSTNFSEPDGD